jgi:hypothetical protein
MYFPTNVKLFPVQIFIDGSKRSLGASVNPLALSFCCSLSEEEVSVSVVFGNCSTFVSCSFPVTLMLFPKVRSRSVSSRVPGVMICFSSIPVEMGSGGTIAWEEEGNFVHVRMVIQVVISFFHVIISVEGGRASMVGISSCRLFRRASSSTPSKRYSREEGAPCSPFCSKILYSFPIWS